MTRWIRSITAAIRKAIWFPLGVFILHALCAHIGGNLYDLYPPLDIPMHFLGGVAVSYFGAALLCQFEEGEFIQIQSAILRAALILALTVSAATFWEYAEWVSDRVLGTHAQKGLDDTILDTVIGFLGGVLYVALATGREIANEMSQPAVAP